MKWITTIICFNIRVFAIYPLLVSGAIRPMKCYRQRIFVDYNPRNGVLATATQLGEVLEIYNLKDSTHVVRVGPCGEPEFKISGGYGLPTGIMGFSDAQVTDRAIYAVFHGRTFKEISQQKEPIIDGGRYIYVFTLDGGDRDSPWLL